MADFGFQMDPTLQSELLRQKLGLTDYPVKVSGSETAANTTNVVTDAGTPPAQAKSATSPTTATKAKEPVTEDELKKASIKQGLMEAGIKGGAGLLAGLAQALMYEDPNARQAGHAGIPGGSVGSVQGGRQMPISYGKQDQPLNRNELALALLGKG